MILLHLATLCGITILSELLPSLLTGDRKAWQKASLVCNIATNPLLNVVMLLAYVYLAKALYFPLLLVLEVLVVVAEALLYRCLLGKPLGKCFAFSLIANICSFGIGLLLDKIL